MLDGRHRDRILGLHAADAARRPDDVRALDMRLVGGQVPDRHRHVDRLDDNATLPMQDAERMRQSQNIAETLQSAVAAAVLGVADVRCAVDGSEIHDVATDLQMTGGVTRMQNELLRCMGELGLNHLAPETHDLACLVHQGAAESKHVARRGAANFNPGLFQHPE